MSPNVTADWVWTGEGKGGPATLVLEGDRIARIQDAPGSSGGNETVSVVIPGLVNAHVHLDLTFERDAPALNVAFADWLLSMRDLRVRAGPDGLRQAIRDGARRSLAAGTTLLVDFDATGDASEVLTESPLRRWVLREVISFDDDFERWRERLERHLSGPGPEREIRGLAPHAPFTVHPDLLSRLVALARERSAPWSIHVAEQPAEEELLRLGSGEYADFLRGVGVDPDRIGGGGSGPIEMLAEGGLLETVPGAPPPLLVHGNYVTDPDIETIRAAGAAVVYCPRSHRWFGHPVHPLRRLLAAGVPVALGTDGLVSSGSLSMLDETAEVARAFPDLPPRRILELATTGARRALGSPWGSGRLEPGEAADFLVLDVEGPGGGSPLRKVVEGRARVREVWIAGERVLPAIP